MIGLRGQTLIFDDLTLYKQNYAFNYFKICNMGCGSSVAQVSDSMKDSPFKPIRLYQFDRQIDSSEFGERVFLFGETRTQRKIIELDLANSFVRSISNRVRIPVPRIHYDPVELMYEQSQQIFHLGSYGVSILPPFNMMVVLTLMKNALFLCGGKDYDGYNIKNEAFYYSIIDEAIKKQASEIKSSHSKERTEYKSKFSSNKFQKIPAMIGKRYAHMGVYLHKHKYILIFGGINEKQELVNTCERFDLLNNTWINMPAMHTNRAFGNCFEFNNKVYVFGGRKSNDKKSKKIEVFDCTTHQWEILNIKIHRGIEKALIWTSAPNEITIVGGNTEAGHTKSVIRVNLLTQTYSWDSSINNQYRSVKGIHTKQELIIFGGKSNCIEQYRGSKWIARTLDHSKYFQADQIQAFSVSSQSLHVQYAAELQKKDNNLWNLNKKCIIFGNDEYPCMLIFDSQCGQIKRESISMKLKIKSKMGIVEYQFGKYFLAGGCDWKQQKAFSSCYFYDSQCNQIQQTVKMNDKKYDFAICALDGFIYTFGGIDCLQKRQKVTCAKFNILNQHWEPLPTLRKPRTKCFAQIINHNKIAVFGGFHNNVPVPGIEIFQIQERKFDIFEPNLELPAFILCSYVEAKNQNSLLILHQSEEEYYELATVNLNKKDPTKTNRSLVSNNLQTIELDSYHKQVLHIQRSKDSQPEHMNLIKIKPKMGEVQQKQPQAESFQMNYADGMDSNESESSFQIQKIELKQLNAQKIPSLQPQYCNPIQNEQSIKLPQQEQVQSNRQKMKIQIGEEKPMKIQIGEEKSMKIQIEERSMKVEIQQKMQRQQGKIITSSPVKWLGKSKYKVIDKYQKIYFINDESFVEYDKNKNNKQQMRIVNTSNIQISTLI